jgi:hypothetical protein
LALSVPLRGSRFLARRGSAFFVRPLRAMDDTSHFAAWAEYRNRRRWFFGIWLGGLVAVILLTGLFSRLLGDLAFYILGPAWLLSFAVAGVRLSLFRCPSCRHCFFSTWTHHNPFRRSCIHCGLPKWSEKDLHETPVA